MALLYISISTPEPPNEPAVPDGLAGVANDTAVRANDARVSCEAYEGDVKKELRHPVHQKLVEALESRRIVLYGLLSLLFPFALACEWVVSREIYGEVFPTFPVIPFTVFVGMAFLASACLAEGFDAFSLGWARPAEPEGEPTQRVVAGLYGRPKPALRLGGRPLWTITGILLATLVEGSIYLLSQKRVELLKDAGEMPEAMSQMQLFLPVALFGVEIVLGLPTFFTVVSAWHWFRLRRLRERLAFHKDQPIILRRAAIDKYGQYMANFMAYNDWARRNGRPERALVPPCPELRPLLVQEFGYDPTRPQGQPGADEPDTSHPEDKGRSEPMTGSDHPGQNPQDGGRDPGWHELLNLLDEQINKENRSI